MGRFAFYQIIYNVQNRLITGIGDMGRFVIYKIIYNVKNCLITGIGAMGSIALLSNNIQCSKLLCHWYWRYE